MTPRTVLFRVPHWRLCLDSIVYTRMRQPFEWGRNDCGLFAADCVQAITGVDLAADLRDLSTRATLRALRRHGGLAGYVSRVLGPAQPPQRATEGDLVLVPADARGREALAVCLGSTAVGPGRWYQVSAPMSAAIYSWPVG